jgi:hypothetical protein
MKLDIKDIKDLPSGGAEMIVDMDPETIRYLVNYAIIDILRKQLQEVDDLWKENASS